MIPALRRLARISRSLAVGLGLAAVAHAQFIPIGAGSFDYDDPLNWVGGLVSGAFVQAQLGPQTIVFDSEIELTNGLNIALVGLPSSLAFESDGNGPLDLTLSGYVYETNLSGSTVTIGSSDANRQINLYLTYSTYFDVATTIDLYSVMSGSNGIYKFGDGTLRLLGANTYSGGTVVEAGTLADGAANAFSPSSSLTVGDLATVAIRFDETIAGLQDYSYLSSGSIDIGSSATLTVADDGFSTFSGIISGDGALTQAGAGTLALNGVNTYTGGTTLANGSLAIAADSALGTAPGSPEPNNLRFEGGTLRSDGTFTLNANRGITLGPDGGTLTGSFAETLSYGGDIIGTGSLTWNGDGTLLYTGLASHTGGTTIANGTVRVGSGGTIGAIAGDIAINYSGTLVVDRSDTNIFPFSVSGDGNLVKAGVGNLVLTGTNPFTGATTINGGAITIASDDASGAGVDVTVASGGTLVVDASITDIATIGSLAGAGAVMVAADKTLNIAGNYANTEFSGVISGDGALAISDNVTRLVLSGTNTYTGGTQLNNGNLEIRSDASLGATSGVLTLNGGYLYLGAAIPDFTHAITMGDGDFQVDTLRFDSTISGAITGPNTLWKHGDGVLTFASTGNTYGGTNYTATNVSGGTLRVGAENALPNGGGVYINAGAVLDVANNQTVGDLSGEGSVVLAADKVLTVANGNYYGTISGDGALVKTTANYFTPSGTNTYTGGTSINGGNLQVTDDANLGDAAGGLAFDGGTLKFTPYSGTFASSRDITLGTGGGLISTNDANADLTFSGIISGPGQLSLETGMFTLDGVNTYSGGTIVKWGAVLNISNNAAIGDTTGALSLDEGTLHTTAALGTLGNDIELGSYNSTIDTGAFDSTFSGQLTGGGGLTKTGSGTLTLTGAGNTYGSSTTVNGGVLRAAAVNALPDGGIVEVGSGARLEIAENQSFAQVTGAGQIAIESGRTLGLTNYYFEFPGEISGAGSLSLSDYASVTLSGANTYTGGTFLTNAYLTVGNGGTSGSLLGDVTLANYSTLTLSRSDNLTFAGAVSGQGYFNVSGGGEITLTGASTYTENTHVADNTTLRIGTTNALPVDTSLSLNPGSTLFVDESQTIAGIFNTGAAGITIAASRTLTLGTAGQPGAAHFSGTIDGAGSLSVALNNLQLSKDNTFTGDTTVTGGTLELGSGTGGNTTGSVAGNIVLVDGGQVNFNRSNAYHYDGTISGTGSVHQVGTGELTFSAANTYSGQTQISGGTLRIGIDNALPATSNVNVSPSGALRVDHNQSIAGLSGYGDVTIATAKILTIDVPTDQYRSFDGVIDGAGALVKNGAGTLDLQGSQSFAGDLTINTGLVTVRSDLAADAVVSGTLQFAYFGAYSHSAAISGVGDLLFSGPGTVTFLADNSFAGLATIDLGVLRLGNGGATGGLNGDITIGTFAQLVVNRAGLLTLPGDISGDGSLVKDGTGTLTLSGLNTFSGGARIDAGTLSVGTAGSLSILPVAIAAGATFDVPVNLEVFSVSGAGAVVLSNDANLTLSGGNANFSGPISGAGQLTSTALQTLSGTNSYSNGTTVAAGLLTVSGSIAHPTADTVVGNVASRSATLSISSGGQITDLRGRIGTVADSFGSVLVSGTGSTWTNLGELLVGENSSGTLSTSNGGSVSATNTRIAVNAGTEGYLNIAGIGSNLTSTGYLHVGESGNFGSLYLGGGATAGAASISAATLTGSSGFIIATGAGSTLTSTGSIQLGEQGYGSIFVNDAATVVISSGGFALGIDNTGEGYAVIAGAGSSVAAPTVEIGTGGSGEFLLVDGGTLHVAGGSGTVTLAATTGEGILDFGAPDDDLAAAPGILNAATITTGTGTRGGVQFNTTATAAAPYYLTTDGTAGGTPVQITGPTQVFNSGGVNVLNRNNTYTGPTTINGGTLIAAADNAFGIEGEIHVADGGTLGVTADATIGNVVELESGATVSGHGFFSSTVTIGEGVTLRPEGDTANSVGTLYFSDLVLAGGGVYEWNLLDANTFDQVVITNPTTLHIDPSTSGNPFVIKLISLSADGTPGVATGLLDGETTWAMFDVSASTVEGFDPDAFVIDASAFATNLTGFDVGQFKLNLTGGNTFEITFSPIPEPSTNALLVIGLGLLGFRWHRRRAKRSNA